MLLSVKITTVEQIWGELVNYTIKSISWVIKIFLKF